jgi:hypothetical protein
MSERDIHVSLGTLLSGFLYIRNAADKCLQVLEELRGQIEEELKKKEDKE